MFVPLTGRELIIGAGSGPPGTIPTPGWIHMGWGLRVSLYVLLNAEHELKVSGEHKPCLFGTVLTGQGRCMCGICRSKLKRGGYLSSWASTSGTWVLESGKPKAHILHFLLTGSGLV